MLEAIYDMVIHEGLVMGGSTGINVAGAIKIAKDMGPGHTIVTVLADYGSRYASKIFNPEFLRSSNRFWFQPVNWDYVIGFRCAREVIP